MLIAKQWWRQWAGAERPWLIIDDGPTFSKLKEFDTASYATLALPGIARRLECDAAFFTAEAAADLSLVKHAANHAQFILVPERDAASAANSSEQTPSLIAELDHQLRLIRYAADAFSGAPGDLTDAAQAMWLLASLGAKNIRTLGVDYGYDPTPETAIKRDGIAAAIQKFNLYSGPLTCEVPARIYIGSDPTQEIGAKLLEYTVRKHATLTTEFDTMQNVKAPVPRDPDNMQRTEFSFSRWAIPALAGYHGRALYVDADMQVFGDMRELWELPFGEATVMYAPSSSPKRGKQTSVMLIDCNRVTWELDSVVAGLDEGRYTYSQLQGDVAIEPAENVQQKLPVDWNMLEEYRANKTRLLHYTDMQKQPWVSRKNDLDYLWLRDFRQAVEEGFVSQDEINEGLRAGILRPSLPAQLATDPKRMRFFRSIVAPILDLRHKPHNKLQQRLKTLRGNKK